MMVAKRPRDENPSEQHFTPRWCVDSLLAHPMARRAFMAASRPTALWLDVGAGGLALSTTLIAWHLHEGRTPPRWLLVEPCLHELAQRKLDQWRPSDRDKALLAALPWVTAADTPRVPEELRRVALTPRALETAALVISNPPFSLAAAFVLAAAEACPSAQIWIHQRVGWIDEARVPLFLELGPPDVYVLPERVAYETVDGVSQDKFPGLSAWYHWRPSFRKNKAARQTSGARMFVLERPEQTQQLTLL